MLQLRNIVKRTLNLISTLERKPPVKVMNQQKVKVKNQTELSYNL